MSSDWFEDDKWWSLTRELRFVARRETDTSQPDGYRYKRILQQRAVSNDTSRWIDVPLFNEWDVEK